MMITAYAWVGGLIEFGEECPKGALPIAIGDEEQVRRVVTTLARHGYKDELLVPGVPEADGQLHGVEALIDFQARVQQDLLKEAA